MTLTLSSLKAAHGSRHRVKRIGRGGASGHGTTATRGTKGQRARQGGRKGLIQLGAKHFVSHLPKVRGFQSFKAQPEAVPVAALSAFAAGTTVTPKLLALKQLISSPNVVVKLIGGGKLAVKLTVEAHSATAGAKVAIEAAGGEVNIIGNIKMKTRKVPSGPRVLYGNQNAK